MAPATTASIHDMTPVVSNKQLSRNTVDTVTFPDGIKTSGQQPPIPSLLYPYTAFPRTISGPTLWHAADYANNPERWTHPFTPSEIAELSAAADNFIDLNFALTGINPSNFPLSESFTASLSAMRNELLNGKGFILYRNFPVREWGNHKSAVAYCGLGSYLGYPVSQNGRGHILGHVKDLGEDSTQIDKVRIYRTNARQFFHADDCDIVGLLCVARALEGGESDLVSTHHIWNLLQAERPDIAELLTKPVWYFDRKGETSKGEEEWIKKPVFFLEPELEGREQRLYCWWDPYYARSIDRFVEQGHVPPLSEHQKEAMDVLEKVCNRVKLHMILGVGDIQLLANSHVLHARTAYRDHAPGSGMLRRHLMRLWLATPEDEAGWRLPFKDSKEKKRGGIQVDDTPPVARIDAD